jgi:cytoskeletal protein RodZ
MSSPPISKIRIVQTAQERHLEQWVTARRREKARKFVLWVVATIVVELAILAPVWWIAAGR